MAEQDQVKAIAQAVLDHLRSGAENDEPLWAAHFDPGFTSVEADGTTHTGIEQVREKHVWWNTNHTVHGFDVEGPYCGPQGFAMKYVMDVAPKDGSWPRNKMEEVAVYTVRDGKVVREEFWYHNA